MPRLPSFLPSLPSFLPVSHMHSLFPCTCTIFCNFTRVDPPIVRGGKGGEERKGRWATVVRGPRSCV
jgi:hypothetical protein